jgi:hypothetical protein
VHIVKVGERHVNLEYLIYAEPIGADGSVRVMVEGGVCLDFGPDAAATFREHLDEIATETAGRPRRVVTTTIIRRPPVGSVTEAGA